MKNKSMKSKAHCTQCKKEFIGKTVDELEKEIFFDDDWPFCKNCFDSKQAVKHKIELIKRKLNGRI